MLSLPLARHMANWVPYTTRGSPSRESRSAYRASGSRSAVAAAARTPEEEYLEIFRRGRTPQTWRPRPRGAASLSGLALYLYSSPEARVESPKNRRFHAFPRTWTRNIWRIATQPKTRSHPYPFPDRRGPWGQRPDRGIGSSNEVESRVTNRQNGSDDRAWRTSMAPKGYVPHGGREGLYALLKEVCSRAGLSTEGPRP